MCSLLSRESGLTLIFIEPFMISPRIVSKSLALDSVLYTLLSSDLEESTHIQNEVFPVSLVVYM